MKICPLLCLFWSIGCAAGSDPIDANTRDIVLLVPGVDGAPRGRFQPFIRSLHEGGVDAPVQIVTWGAPAFLFFVNFNAKSVHEHAEQELAHRIESWRSGHPDGRIDIVAHSAGCGVTLGALHQLNENVQVGTVILLAPSVSPGYDMAGSIAHLSGQMHVFYSDRDTVFLSWRTGTFGTYDNIKTRAAGNRGFEQHSDRLTQHPYEHGWENLGNGGGHFDWLAPDFAREVLAPLLKPSSPS